METERNYISDYIIPFVHFLVWTTSLCIGIFFLTENNGLITEKVIISSFSIYVPFLVESAIIVWDIKTRYCRFQFNDGILNILIWTLFNIAVSVVFSLLFFFGKTGQDLTSNPYLICMLFAMAIEKLIVSYFNANIQRYIGVRRIRIYNPEKK